MKIKRFSHVALLTLLFLCLSHSSVFGKDEWLQVRSKNFNLIGDTSEKDIRRVATKLEQFREVLRQVLNKANFNSPIPTTVVVINDGRFRLFRPFL